MSCRGGAVIEHAPLWSALAGYALGWLMGRLDRETHDDPRRRINHENKRRTVGPRPRQQPLTADLIRYWRWQNEQVRQALEEDTNSPRRSRD